MTSEAEVSVSGATKYRTPMLPTTSTKATVTESTTGTPELATPKTTRAYEATKKTPTTAMMSTPKPDASFFPDNDALESNLKQFDLDYKEEIGTAGNFYDDGSLHASQIVGDDDALSDIMPGMDSNSRVEIDPRALDLQAKRRAYVQKYNQAIWSKIQSGQLRA